MIGHSQYQYRKPAELTRLPIHLQSAGLLAVLAFAPACAFAQAPASTTDGQPGSSTTAPAPQAATLPAIKLSAGNVSVEAFTTKPAAPAAIGAAPGAALGITGSTSPLFGSTPPGTIGGGGIHATFGTDSLTVGLTGASAVVTPSNLLPNPSSNSLSTVYGADVSGHLFGNRVLVDSDFAVSPTGTDNSLTAALADHDNTSYRALLGYNFGSWSLKGGYQAIGTNFASPLTFLDMGSWSSPNNVAGPEFEANFQPTHSLSIGAHGNFLQGQEDAGALSPVGKNDQVSNLNLRAEYKVAGSSSIDLGYEWVQWNLHNDQGLLAAAGTPSEQYITVGVGHNFGDTALKMLYSVGNYTDDGTHMAPSGQNSHDEEAITQLSVAF